MVMILCDIKKNITDISKSQTYIYMYKNTRQNEAKVLSK